MVGENSATREQTVESNGAGAGAATAVAVETQLGAKPSAPKPQTPTRPHPESAQNLGLLLDISVPIAVELGATKMMIKDILQLAPGSIVELEKMAGEPVDLLARGKLIAQGEVVVVDECFGVRITRIVSPDERVESLGEA